MGMTWDEVAKKAKDIKVFGFDLDGTFLREDKSVSPRTRACVEAMLEKGIQPVPTTGRTWQFLPEGELGMGGFNYLVAACGGVVRDLNTGEFISRRTLEPAQAAALIRALQKPGVAVYVCLDDEAGTRMGTSASAEEFARVAAATPQRNGFDGVDVPDKVEELGINVVKVGIHYLEPWVRKDFLALPECAGLTVNPSWTNNLEWNAGGVSKTGGLKMVAERLGLGLENVCSIGDSGNDVDMLASCGLGICMGNGFPEAREAADATLTLTNEQDGLADFVERFLLS